MHWTQRLTWSRWPWGLPPARPLQGVTQAWLSSSLTPRSRAESCISANRYWSLPALLALLPRTSLVTWEPGAPSLMSTGSGFPGSLSMSDRRGKVHRGGRHSWEHGLGLPVESRSPAGVARNPCEVTVTKRGDPGLHGGNGGWGRPSRPAVDEAATCAGIGRAHRQGPELGHEGPGFTKGCYQGIGIGGWGAQAPSSSEDLPCGAPSFLPVSQHLLCAWRTVYRTRTPMGDYTSHGPRRKLGFPGTPLG